MNIKKGQFLSPWEMSNVVEKARSTGNADIMVCERGFSFGYNNLVSDMRALAVMRELRRAGRVRRHAFGAAAGRQGHGLGRPARVRAGAGARGGRRRASRASSWKRTRTRRRRCRTGPNAWPLPRMRELLTLLVELDRAVKSRPFAEASL